MIPPAIVRRVAWVALTVALLCAAACRAPATDPKARGEIRVLWNKGPLSLSFIGKSDRYSELFGQLVSCSLVAYDAGLRFVPQLAESWDVSEDGRVATFRLRRDARWHDGEPVTAADVVHTVEKVRDPASEAIAWYSYFDAVEALDAPDPYTLRVTYAQPYPDYLEAWRVPLLPAHLAAAQEDFLGGEFAQRPVGCGAFRFVRYVPDRVLELEANSDHWEGPPRASKMTAKVFPDLRTAYEAMLQGELDLMTLTPDLWLEAAETPRAARFERTLFYSLRTWYVGWNQDGSNPFFTDARVRRAMMLALDRETFNRSVLHGMALTAVTTYHPHSPWTDPSVPPWPYDPGAARRLLAEAGWRDTDGDGVLDRDGRPFRFTLLRNTSTQDIVNRIVEWMQQELADIGVEMEIEVVEWATFQKRRREHRFEAMLGTLSFSPAPETFELYHSSAREGGFNYVGLSDPEIDELVSRGRRTVDESARREIYHRLQRRLHELEPLGNLFHVATPVLIDGDLRGVETSPMGYFKIVPGPRGWHWGGS